MQERTEQAKLLRYPRAALVVMVAGFLTLAGNLTWLQLVKGAEYRDQAKGLMIKKRSLAAKRGAILDRRGRVLVDNEIHFNVYIVPERFTERAFDTLRKYLELDDERSSFIRTRILEAQGDKRQFSLLAVPAITADQRARLEANAFELPGVRVLSEYKRRYPYGSLAAHLIGYLNEVSGEELRRLQGYNIGDQIGRFGVERQWEWYLRGRMGFERYVVDVRRVEQRDPRLLRLLGPKETRFRHPEEGYYLRLTLDLELQRLVESSLRWHPSGAAVVVEVETGRILAISSKPAFDPALLSRSLTREQARQLYDNPYHPMLDKTVMGSYFPGSTFKVISAIAALEERLVDTSEYIFCKMFHEYGQKSAFRCTAKHGAMAFHSAIVQSCNIYFYNMGERVGMNRLSRYARDFGLGTPTGLGLNGERGGFIPTKAWYTKNMPGGFRVGHTLNAAVGQGNVTVTPLQLAMLYATIANGGRLYLPQIVERVESADGRTVLSYPPQLRRRVQVSDRTLSLVKAGLRGVVSEEGGTANEVWDGQIPAAGKTGTAQVIKRELRTRDPREHWRFNDHAWFAAYAPWDKPEIAVVVLVEHGGSAGKVAAPVALRIIRDYFARVKPREARPRNGLPGGAPASSSPGFGPGTEPAPPPGGSP
ncbi:MAG: penicillin-binding protein 2 [Polyangia bacterium]|jgi:penicillin-binding protein 2|nr:penicillin-binding protein 2 [Polyangia bacterium]